MCKSHDLVRGANSPYFLFLLFLTSKHHHILPPLSSPLPPYLPLAPKLPPTSILCVCIYSNVEIKGMKLHRRILIITVLTPCIIADITICNFLQCLETNPYLILFEIDCVFETFIM
ncbi:hypothetical protein LguiA_025708 [Lonicera macranthoides]